MSIKLTVTVEISDPVAFMEIEFARLIVTALIVEERTKVPIQFTARVIFAENGSMMAVMSTLRENVTI